MKTMTNEQLDNIFNLYNTLAGDGADPVTERHMHALLMFAIDSPYMDFDGDRLTFAKGSGPLASVEIERICGADDLGSHIAVILPASMILINKNTGDLNVYLPD